MRVGVWGDDAPSRMAKDSYANKLQQLKITRVALMMNYANVSRSAEPWDLRWNDKGEEGWHDDIIARIADKYEKRASASSSPLGRSPRRTRWTRCSSTWSR
jgi:hypothetical protein